MPFDTKLKSNVETNKEKTYVLRDRNIITVAPSVSVPRKYCSSRTVLTYENNTLHLAVLRWDGRDLAENLMNIFTDRMYSFTPTPERAIASETNEKHATFSRIRTPMLCHQTASMFQETGERMIKELTALAPIHDDGHGDRSTRVKVLGMDWGMFFHAPSSAFSMCSVSVQMSHTVWIFFSTLKLNALKLWPARPALCTAHSACHEKKTKTIGSSKKNPASLSHVRVGKPVNRICV